jgi:1,4-dihydroxy-2-naphthoate octaprenyltransferase
LVGDITRAAYLTSLPIAVATGLWVWMDELASRMDDEKVGRKTMVMLFGPRFSGRSGVLALSMLFFASLLLAVFSASMSPLTLIALLLVGLVGKIVIVSWNEYSCSERMSEMRTDAFMLHLATCSVIAASPLVALLT